MKAKLWFYSLPLASPVQRLGGMKGEVWSVLLAVVPALALGAWLVPPEKGFLSRTYVTATLLGDDPFL